MVIILPPMNLIVNRNGELDQQQLQKALEDLKKLHTGVFMNVGSSLIQYIRQYLPE